MTSALNDLGATPVDGVVFRPCMLGDGRLGSLTSNAGFSMLFKSRLEVSFGLTDVDLPTRAWYLYTTFACFSAGRGSLTLVSMDRRLGPDLNTTLMFKFRHAFLILSLTPYTYGSNMSVGLPSSTSGSHSRGVLSFDAALMKAVG